MKKLPLPEAVFKQHTIILGKTRSGKSSAARLMVEHLLDQEKPVTIIDPKGDWWGIKASADGKHAGYPLVIFGGEHADVALNARSGASVAELLATGNRSAVIDLGGWMVSDRTQFWIDFASTYFRTHKGRHFLMIDEVHNLCPKGKIMDPNAGKMLHWSNRLASEGLGKGITMIAASQRPQKVHNDFLTSCETLIAMRVIHKADREALKDWIDACGDPEVGKEVLATVAGFKRGEAWGYSPEADFGPERIQFPMFATYDSFRPQDAADLKLKGWAEVDLEDVKKKLDQAVKEAEANDPAKLKKRIAELEAEARKKKPAAVHTETKVDYELADEWKRHALSLRDYGQYLEKQIGEIRKAVEDDRIARVLNRMTIDQRKMPEWHPPLARTRTKIAPPPVSTVSAPTRIHRAESNGAGLAKAERAILSALSSLRAAGKDRPTRAEVAGWSGYPVSSGGFKNPMGALRTAGHLDYPSEGLVRITESGLAIVGETEPYSPDQLYRLAIDVANGKAEIRMIEALYQAAGELTREQLSEKTGYPVTSGGFKNPLGALRSKGILDYPASGVVKLSDWVFGK